MQQRITPGQRRGVELKTEIRELTKSADFYDELQLQFYREQTAYGVAQATECRELSAQIFERNINPHSEKTIFGHVAAASPRAKALYTALVSLGIGFSVLVAAQNDDVESGAVYGILTLSMVLPVLLGAIDHFIRMDFSDRYVSAHVPEYYRKLVSAHRSLLRLSVPRDGNIWERHGAEMEIVRDIEAVVAEMREHIAKHAPVEPDGATDEEHVRVSGVFVRDSADDFPDGLA